MSPKGKAAGVLVTPTTAHTAHDCANHSTGTAQKTGTSDRKRFLTLQARAALAGVMLIASTNDNGAPVYIASRWALCRELPDLDAAEHWLGMVTGALP